MLVRDALGRDVDVPSPPSRAVSLVPSVTETLFEIGAGESVVGITDFCIFPENALEHLPRVGGTKNPDVDAIRGLCPDLVYMNLEENLRRHAEEIEQFTTVYASEPRTVFDVVDLILTLGRIHAVESEATGLAEAIREEARVLRLRTKFTFAVAIWKDPWMWCGGDTYVSNLVEAVGGENVLHDETRYPKLTVDGLLAHHPDIVFLPDEPYRFEPEDREALRDLGFDDVRGPFPGHYFTWHGSRTLKALELLAEWAR